MALITQDLDFLEIKKNLIEFLKSQDEFKDYEYYGSGMNILMDTLAYNTHYMGMYAHMLANESFIESIIRKENMNSKAKLLSYIPRSVKSSRCVVNITVADPVDGNRVKIDRGTTYQAKNPNTGGVDARTFILIDDLYIYYNDETSDYTSTDVSIYEGTFKTEDFISGYEKRYVIRDENIDTDTLRVIVKETKESEEYTVFSLAKNFTTIDDETNAFFLHLNENDMYEISFGNGVYGASVTDGSYIEATFVSSNGELGNSVTDFINPTDVTIAVVESSTDGSPRESIEDMRHSIPSHYRRQNRLVTVEDYKNIITSEYGNISSLNVWGGEDNDPIDYGKVYIAIKPIYGEYLSNHSKNTILNILKQYSVAAIESVIVDPEYLYINLEINIRNNTFNTDKRHGELKNLVLDAVDSYNSIDLSKFDTYYSDVKLSTKIMDVSPSFMTTYTNITLEKRFVPTLLSDQTYFIYFTNELRKNTLTSNTFTFRNYTCKIGDDGLGNIIVYFWNSSKKEYEQFPNEYFGEIDYKSGTIKIFNIVFTNLSEDDIKLYAQPINPLFFTKKNTVLSIDDVVINIEDYHGREDEK